MYITLLPLIYLSSPSLRMPQLSEIIGSLVDVANLHALLEAVSNGPLARRGVLGERYRATKGTGRSAVAHASHAHVGDTGNCGVAGHAGGHLDLHGEFGGGCKRDTLDTETGDVLCDLSLLESRLLGSAGGAVDISGEGTSAILVDLMYS